MSDEKKRTPTDSGIPATSDGFSLTIGPSGPIALPGLGTSNGQGQTGRDLRRRRSRSCWPSAPTAPEA